MSSGRRMACVHMAKTLMWRLPELDGFSFRPAIEADFEFIFLLIKRTMQDYVVATFGGWDDEQQRPLIRGLNEENPPQILLAKADPIGMLTTYPEAGGLRIRQIYILPNTRTAKSAPPFWRITKGRPP